MVPDNPQGEDDEVGEGRHQGGGRERKGKDLLSMDGEQSRYEYVFHQ